MQKSRPGLHVLSDPGNRIAPVGFGILTQPRNWARAAQLELGLDLTAFNADGTTGLPMPTFGDSRRRSCPAVDRRAP